MCSFGSPVQQKHGHTAMSTENATEITNRLENLTWEEGLRELGLCNLEKAQGKPCQGV